MNKYYDIIYFGKLYAICPEMYYVLFGKYFWDGEIENDVNVL